MRKEKSCGCIIINNNQVLLVLEKNGNFWGFPKGHIENNETEIETAKREVKEEVGIEVEIDKSKRYELTYYIKDDIEKTCVFYIAKPQSLNINIQETEISNAKWYNFDLAIKTISYNNLKKILEQAISEL